MKTEDLKAQGLTDEQISFVMAENGKDLKKLQKENDTLTTDRDAWKEKAEAAEETLKGFEGIDPAEMQAKIDEYKQKAEDAEKEYNRKIAERDFEDTLTMAIKEANGKNAKAIRALLDTESLMKSRNQKDDVKKALDDLKAAEDSSFLFVDEAQQQAEKNAAHFGPVTAPRGQQTPPGTMTRKDIEGIKDAGERQAAIAQNLHLFGKSN